MQVREDEIEEEYMDTLYARKPVDASSFPEGNLKWFKSNDTLNFGVGKVVVAGLAWILHHFEPQDGKEVLCGFDGAFHVDESWHQPSTLLEVKECIVCIYNEFEVGDIVSYIDEKCYEYEDAGESRTDMPLYMRIDYESIFGASEEALNCNTFEEMRPHIQDLLDLFCAAYQLQYIA
jgi:hypothetical protein